MELDLKQRLARQDLIRLAVIYAAGKNGNMPAHVRRILQQKFNVEVFEIEVEAECQLLAGETVSKLARAAQKVAA